MTDKDILRFVQNDLPLVSRPYAALADKLGTTEDEICSKLRAFRESGLIRRFGAMLGHAETGYTANAMVVWKIKEGNQDEAAAVLARNDAVSHLYARPDFPGWPCNLFSMIHARSENELVRLIDDFTEKLSAYCDEHRVLRTLREFKKTSMKYFAED